MDDNPIGKTNLDYLRNQIAYVAQEPFLFNLSIKDNLILAKPAASMDEIHQVCTQANIHHYIMGITDTFFKHQITAWSSV